MILLAYVFMILFISGVLILGIDAIVHTHRHEKWMWQLIVVSRIRSASVFGMNIDELEKNPDSILPPESIRILFTRISGGLLIISAITAFCVLIAVFAAR